ncbi:MAG: Fe-S cluster assembly sulfur transfer protein SufU [Fimbriimonadales bacterium]
MSELLADLYQEVILDHSRSPRGVGEVEDKTHSAFISNPLCGDEVSISARVVDGVIQEVKHHSTGCAICVASASMMVEAVQGKPTEEFRRDSEAFCKLARGESDNIEGKLMAFAGVSKFPMRVKCATLPWHALENALDK